MLPQSPFYLIRHGESEANAAQITAGGGLDSPLTEKGCGQPKTLAPLLGQLQHKPDIIYHSSMQRARDTAIYLNKGLGLEMIEEHHLREHEMGEWEGKLWSEVQPELDNGNPPPNGETQAQFSQRIQATITDILDKETPQDRLPMLVAHGGLFHALGFMYEYGMSPIQNCHLHLFEPEPRFSAFPWKVSQFDIEGDKLVKSAAPFCLSHAMDKIA